MDNLISTLWPTVCIFCNRFGPMICNKCSYGLSVVEEAVCLVCKLPSLEGFTHISCLKDEFPTQLFSCFEYSSKVKKAIKLSKFEPYIYGALEELTHRGLKYALSVGYYLFDYVVVPIPITRKTKKKRGFNQAVLIGRIVGYYLGLPVEDNLLRKNKVTMLEIDFTQVSGKKVLLVDDVSITGNTLREYSRVLYAAGAVEVRCFTLSRCYNAPDTLEGWQSGNAAAC